MHLLEQSQHEPPLAVITGIDYHCWPVLVFAPGEHDKCACQSTVFEPDWLSLFCAPSEPQKCACRPMKCDCVIPFICDNIRQDPTDAHHDNT